ncbi:MAG TPA: class E sortase [Mycobacteriales bacterium]|nr:class E sortase [Mycobacteriales bacterium]
MSSPEPNGDSFLPRAATTAGRPVGGLMGVVLRRPGGRRAVSGLIGLLCVSAVGVLAFPAVTDLLGAQRQRHAHFDPNDPAFKNEFRSGAVRVGQGLTRLEIHNDRVQVSVVVVEGTSVAALQAGAGHYPETPYPCARGNVAIAGHRTTYGRPFNRIDQMRPGDKVTLITPIGSCVYQVVPPFAPYTKNPFIVSPNDVSVVGQTGKLATGHWLTLTSCNPPGSASQRIVLRLKMISSTVRVALPNPNKGSGGGPTSVDGGV